MKSHGGETLSTIRLPRQGGLLGVMQALKTLANIGQKIYTGESAVGCRMKSTISQPVRFQFEGKQLGRMSDVEVNQRREVFYSGRVQGVGFRYSTLAIAKRFVVTGFVRNLADRRVRVVAEGAPHVLDEFLSTIADTMQDYIHDAQVSSSTPTGEFTKFEISF